jgi:microcompartment protein CcmK/EutM
MYIAKVIGTVVATKKDAQLVGKKLLIISLFNGKDYSGNKIEVAIDSVGAGIGEEVLAVRGSSARKILDNADSPIDMAIVGIIDTMEINNR